MPVGQFRRTRLAAVLLAALVVGCSAPDPISLPTRPPVPDGWAVIGRGGVQVAAPAEWGTDIGGLPQSITLIAFFPPGDNADGISLMVTGPHSEAQPEPPFTDVRLADWLKTLYTNQQPTSYSSSVVLLPAGRAVAFRATFYGGTRDATEHAYFAIPTTVGVVTLQILVDSDLMGRYGSAMALIPYLLAIDLADKP